MHLELMKRVNLRFPLIIVKLIRIQKLDSRNSIYIINNLFYKKKSLKLTTILCCGMEKTETVKFRK